MAFDPVPDSALDSGNPTKQEIFVKTKDNQADHENRVAALEALLSVQTLTGELKPYGGGVAPSGWLLCDGLAVSRMTYSALFGVIGTTYGAGDGSTTFNLPDGRGRNLLGVNNGGLPNGENGSLSTRNRGNTGGAEGTTLIESDLPPHTHTIAHTHDLTDDIVANAGTGTATGVRTDPDTLSDFTRATAGVSTPDSGVGNGTSTAAPSMNPFVVVNYLIKT